MMILLILLISLILCCICEAFLGVVGSMGTRTLLHHFASTVAFPSYCMIDSPDIYLDRKVR